MRNTKRILVMLTQIFVPNAVIQRSLTSGSRSDTQEVTTFGTNPTQINADLSSESSASIRVKFARIRVVLDRFFRTLTEVITILIFGLILSQQCWAETIIWQRPLVFELNLDKPGTYEYSSIPTDGIITSITANWNFQGEVTLEISADGGNNYIPLINGVKEDKGFVPGNQLRFKVNVGEDSKVKTLKLTYTDTSGVAYTFGKPQLSGFRYLMPIYIAYSGDENKDLLNYPVKITIPLRNKGYSRHSGNSSQDDLTGPVRFTAADGETLIPYYRELEADSSLLKGKRSPASIDFWVRVPQITKDGIYIYLYYGNPKAKDLSSGKDVFDFFDDFEGEILKEEKWQLIPDLKGTGNISDGKLFLENGELKSSIFKVQENSLIEFKAQVVEPHADIQAILDRLVFYSSGFTGAQHAIARDGKVEVNLDLPIEPGLDYIYQIARSGNNLVFTRSGNGEEAKIVMAADSSFEPQSLRLKSASAYNRRGGSYFDWVRVRPFFEAKPCIVSLGKIEMTNLAQYTDEYYISQKVSTDFPVRIIVSGTNKELSISADGGRTYAFRNSPHSGGGVPDVMVYYYASKGDFKAGESLCWKVELQEDEFLPDKISIDYYPGTITLISPNGGEQLLAGSNQQILWSAEEYERTYPLLLEYSVDGGKTYVLIAKGVANTGSYLWRLPVELNNQILIKISDLLAPEVYDLSDGLVEIKDRM